MCKRKSILNATIVTLLAFLTMTSCSQKLVVPAFGEADVLARSKSLGDEYAISVVSPQMQIVVGGKYDTVTPMLFTEVVQDSLSEYSMIYIDDTPVRFVPEGGNALRCVYASFDTSFYSVKFENVELQQDRISFVLVIAGREVGRVIAYALDGEAVPESVDGLLAVDGSGNKLLRKIASLVPPIDFSLGGNHTITANSGNGAANGSGGISSGGNYPCVTPQSVSLLCTNASLMQAEMYKHSPYWTYIHHGECHNGCTYAAK